MNSACAVEAPTAGTLSVDSSNCFSGDLAATVLLGATTSGMSPLARVREEFPLPCRSGRERRASEGTVSHCMQHLRCGTHLSFSPLGGTNSSFLSPMPVATLGAETSTTNATMSPANRISMEGDNAAATATAAETLSDVGVSSVNQSSLLFCHPVMSPVAETEDGNRSACDESLMEDHARRSAALSMVWSGAHNASSIRLDGSMMEQTLMLHQSTVWQSHTPSPCTATFTSSSVPIVSCPGNTNVGGQAGCWTKTEEARITRDTLNNGANEGASKPWKRVKLMSLQPINALEGSPMPQIPVSMMQVTEARALPEGSRVPSPPWRSGPPEMGDFSSGNDISVHFDKQGGFASPSSRTPQREGSPSRPPSTVECGDASRQLNLSLMSGSMSFRPSISSANSMHLPKESPLAFDGSLQGPTPTSSAVLKRPKPRVAVGGEKELVCSAQFVNAFCGRHTGFTASGKKPFARDVETGSGNRSGGGFRRSSAKEGLSFVDMYDTAALTRGRLPTKKVTDTTAFQLWSPLGLDQDASAAVVTNSASVGPDVASLKIRNSKKTTENGTNTGGEYDNKDLDCIDTTCLALTPMDASEFSFNRDADTVTTTTEGVLQGEPIVMLATSFSVGSPVNDSTKGQRD